MIDLLNAVEARAKALTTGELFPSPGGDMVEVKYKVGDYPYKTGGDEDIPLCVVLLRDFSMMPRPERVTVQLSFTLYNNTGSLAAMADIKRLAALLHPLAGRGAQFQPWKLDKAAGFVGDKENGAHPDPQYYLTSVLEFSKGR